MCSSINPGMISFKAMITRRTRNASHYPPLHPYPSISRRVRKIQETEDILYDVVGYKFRAVAAFLPFSSGPSHSSFCPLLGRILAFSETRNERTSMKANWGMFVVGLTVGVFITAIVALHGVKYLP